MSSRLALYGRRVAVCIVFVPAIISAVCCRFAAEMRWALKFCWWDAQTEVDSLKRLWRDEKP